MPRVTEIYAYVMADSGPDDEGIPAFNMQGLAMPMVGSDLERVKSLRPFAQGLANSQKKPIKLIRFSHMEIIDTVEPNGDTSIEVGTSE